MQLREIANLLSAGPTSDERGDHDLNPDQTRPPKPLIPAAVLVPLIQRPKGLTVLLTKRTPHLRDHGGQICFPGGRIEDHDETPTATALRETEEEVGLRPEQVAVHGQLDHYVTRTGFTVTPIVGSVRPPVEIRPDPFEVEEVFEVPLDFFLDRDNHQCHSRVHRGEHRRFYAIPYGDFYIWGATAGMLVNLVDVLTAGYRVPSSKTGR